MTQVKYRRIEVPVNFTDHFHEAAELMRVLGHDGRLAVITGLLERREMTVTELAKKVGLAQSSLSQHLARMRAAGIVEPRRDGQSVYYCVSNRRIAQLVTAICEIYTDPETEPSTSDQSGRPKATSARS